MLCPRLSKAKQIRHSDVLGDRCSLSQVKAQTMNGAIAPRPALNTRSRAQTMSANNFSLPPARLPMPEGIVLLSNGSN
jgi:hypothetical protein